jgi:hypothetical protein
MSMPLTLNKKAYEPGKDQRVQLTAEEREILYGTGSVKLAYDYDPVKHDWDSMDWAEYERQFDLLCKLLGNIAQDLVRYPSSNPTLSAKIAEYKATYPETIKQLSAQVRFHGTNNVRSQYASGDNPGKPVFFAELKSFLEVILLDLARKLKKLETGTATETEKDDALARLHGAIQEAAKCNEGAHEKYRSMKEEIEGNKGLKGLVHQKFNETFVQIGAEHCKTAFKRLELQLLDLGVEKDKIPEAVVNRNRLGNGTLKTLLDDWVTLVANEVHAPHFFKNLAHEMRIFPQGCVFEPYKLVPAFTWREEQGIRLLRMVSPGNNALKLYDLELQDFQPKLDRLFNADSLLDFITSHLFTEIMTPYRNLARKEIKTPNEHLEAMNELNEAIEELMGNMELKREFGFFDERKIEYTVFDEEKKESKIIELNEDDYLTCLIDGEFSEDHALKPLIKGALEAEKLKITYAVRSELEVYYWSRLLAMRTLGKVGFLSGVAPVNRTSFKGEIKGQVVFKVSNEVEEWFETENGEMIPLSDLVESWDEEKLRSIIPPDAEHHFDLINLLNEALKRAAKFPDLQKHCQAEREKGKFNYNLKQIGKDNPHFAFDDIADLDNLMRGVEEKHQNLLPALVLSLQACRREQINVLFVNAVNQPGKPGHRVMAKNVLRKMDQIKENLPLGVPFPSSRIYLSRALIDECFKLAPDEAQDALLDSWFGSLPDQLPRDFFGMRDYTSVLNFKHEDMPLSELFAKYPPMISMYLMNVPEKNRVEAIRNIFEVIYVFSQIDGRVNLIREILDLSIPEMKKMVTDFAVLEGFFDSISHFNDSYYLTFTRMKDIEIDFSGQPSEIIHAMITPNASKFTIKELTKYLEEQSKSYSGLTRKAIDFLRHYLAYAKLKLQNVPGFARDMTGLLTLVLELNNRDNQALKSIAANLDDILMAFDDAMGGPKTIQAILRQYLPKIKSFVLFRNLNLYASESKIDAFKLDHDQYIKLKRQYNIDQSLVVDEKKRSSLCIESIDDLLDLEEHLKGKSEVIRLIIADPQYRQIMRVITQVLLDEDDKNREFARNWIESINGALQRGTKLWLDSETIDAILGQSDLSDLEKINRLPVSWRSEPQVKKLLNENNAEIMIALCANQNVFFELISNDINRLRVILKGCKDRIETNHWIGQSILWVSQSKYPNERLVEMAGIIRESIASFDDIFRLHKEFKLSDNVNSLIRINSESVNIFLSTLFAKEKRDALSLTAFVNDLRDSAVERPQEAITAIFNAFPKTAVAKSAREPFILLTKLSLHNSRILFGRKELSGSTWIDLSSLSSIIFHAVEGILVELRNKTSLPTQILKEWGVLDKNAPSVDAFFLENQDPLLTLHYLRFFVYKKVSDLGLIRMTTQEVNPEIKVAMVADKHELWHWVVDRQGMVMPGLLDEELREQVFKNTAKNTMPETDLAFLTFLFPGRFSEKPEYQKMLARAKLSDNSININATSLSNAAFLNFDNLSDLESLLESPLAVDRIKEIFRGKVKPAYHKICDLISKSMLNPSTREATKKILKSFNINNNAHQYFNDAFYEKTLTMNIDEAKDCMVPQFQGSLGYLKWDEFPTLRNFNTIRQLKDWALVFMEAVTLSPIVIKKFMTDVPEDKMEEAFTEVMKLSGQWINRNDLSEFVHDKLKTYLINFERIQQVSLLVGKHRGFDLESLITLAYESHGENFSVDSICNSKMATPSKITFLKRHLEKWPLTSLSACVGFMEKVCLSVAARKWGHPDLSHMQGIDPPALISSQSWFVDVLNQSSSQEIVLLLKAIEKWDVNSKVILSAVKKITDQSLRDQVVEAYLPSVNHFNIYNQFIELCSKETADKTMHKARRESLKLAYNNKIVGMHRSGGYSSERLAIETLGDLTGLYDNYQSAHSSLNNCLSFLADPAKKLVSHLLIDAFFDGVQNSLVVQLTKDLPNTVSFLDSDYLFKKLTTYYATGTKSDWINVIPQGWRDKITKDHWSQLLPDNMAFTRIFGSNSSLFSALINKFPALIDNYFKNSPTTPGDFKSVYNDVYQIYLKNKNPSILPELIKALSKHVTSYDQIDVILSNFRADSSEFKQIYLELLKSKGGLFNEQSIVEYIKKSGKTDSTVALFKQFVDHNKRSIRFAYLISHASLMHKEFIDCLKAERQFYFDIGRMTEDEIIGAIKSLILDPGYSDNYLCIGEFIISSLLFKPQSDYIIQPLINEGLIPDSFLIRYLYRQPRGSQMAFDKLPAIIQRWLAGDSADHQQLTTVFTDLFPELEIPKMNLKDDFTKAFLDRYIRYQYRADILRTKVISIRNNSTFLVCYYDNEKDQYIDFEVSLDRSNGETKLLRPIAGGLFPTNTANPYAVDLTRGKLLYDSTLPLDEFKKKYLISPTAWLSVTLPNEVFQPAFTERFKYQAQLLGEAYLQKTLYPALFKTYISMRELRRFNGTTVFDLFNELFPVNDYYRDFIEFHEQLDSLSRNQNIFVSMKLEQISKFLGWMNQLEPACTETFLTGENLNKLFDRIKQLPIANLDPFMDLSKLYPPLINYLQQNGTILRHCNMEAVYHMLARLSPDYTTYFFMPDSPNAGLSLKLVRPEVFLQFYHQKPSFSDRSLIYFCEPIHHFLNVDTFERILMEIHPGYWPTVLRIAMQLPDSVPDLNFDFLCDKGNAETKLTTSFIAYKQGKSFTEKLKAVAGSSSSTPNLIEKLQALCENHTLQDNELPKVKTIFAQHFARLYREGRVGEAFVNDQVNKAVFQLKK